MSDRLFTPRFFVMCGFTFTVFLSAFQLLPTAPFRIQELGGTTFASGLFLGFLTYASALSAPLTGAIADRIGRRRTLSSPAASSCSARSATALTTSYRVMLALVVVHGVFWSGLLSASAAYLTSLLPERRRAEGIGYWGLSSVAAIAVAPPIAFWIMQHGGWRWICISCGTLNVLMGVIAWYLDRATGRRHPAPAAARRDRAALPIIEWRVLALSLTLFLYSFGYGAITSFSAMYADAHRRHAEEPVPDGAGDRDPADAAAVRPARRPHRLPARVHAVPGPDRLRPGAPGDRLDAAVARRLGRSSSASASAPPTRCSSPT